MIHPELLIAAEIVGRVPFNGQSDADKILLVDMGESMVAVISVEDLISDRIARYLAGPSRHPDMLGQAFALYELAETIDKSYLNKRLRQETAGEMNLAKLESEFDAYRDDFAAREDH